MGVSVLASQLPRWASTLPCTKKSHRGSGNAVWAKLETCLQLA